MIEEGAIELLVPGNLPIGCSAVYLTLFGTTNKDAYDKNGCLKAYNAFSKYHNAKLKLGIENLRKEYPHAKIIYGDYYGAAKRLFHAPKHYGKFMMNFRFLFLKTLSNFVKKNRLWWMSLSFEYRMVILIYIILTIKDYGRMNRILLILTRCLESGS